MKIAEKHNLKVIEDAAQSPGALYGGKLTGTIGDIGVYSLNSNKVIQCGEGGIAVTNDSELAEKLIELHPWADMVRYTRSGGEAMTVAVRIARAASGKDKVLFCGYHGWHDWYLSANLSDDVALDGHLLPGLEPKGVPRNLQGTSIPFLYNDTVGFLSLLEKHKNEVGVVVLETVRNDIPNKDFIETIRIKTKELGIVLVLDEITCGWRICVGGAHLKLGFDPDIAVYGKAMSNGYPMAAIVGKKEVMEAAQGSFISSTSLFASNSIVLLLQYPSDFVPISLAKKSEYAQ